MVLEELVGSSEVVIVVLSGRDRGGGRGRWGGRCGPVLCAVDAEAIGVLVFESAAADGEAALLVGPVGPPQPPVHIVRQIIAQIVLHLHRFQRSAGAHLQCAFYICRFLCYPITRLLHGYRILGIGIIVKTLFNSF